MTPAWFDLPGPQLFVDMDGVLVDCDGHYEARFGVRPDRAKTPPEDFWQRLRGAPAFFEECPPLPGALEFWDRLQRLHPVPVLLSGIPTRVGVSADAARAKARWARAHLGPDVPVLLTESRNKRAYCRRGDVLIDDWPKYQSHWEGAGGLFVLHTHADTSVEQAHQYLHWPDDKQRPTETDEAMLDEWSRLETQHLQWSVEATARGDMHDCDKHQRLAAVYTDCIEAVRRRIRRLGY
jgi:hypothetical protein